jgi:transcriptional regulator with XRE-family HTH domain
MDIYEARRQVVLRLIRSRFGGSQAEFAAKTGIPPSYVTRMLKEAGATSFKRIGDDMALKIENKLDLEPGSVLNPVAGREPAKAQPAAPPPAPPRNFEDRHWVSDSDFATLQAVHVVFTPEQIADIRTRAAHAERTVRERLAVTAGGSADPPPAAVSNERAAELPPPAPAAPPPVSSAVVPLVTKEPRQGKHASRYVATDKIGPSLSTGAAKKRTTTPGKK